MSGPPGHPHVVPVIKLKDYTLIGTTLWATGEAAILAGAVKTEDISTDTGGSGIAVTLNMQKDGDGIGVGIGTTGDNNGFDIMPEQATYCLTFDLSGDAALDYGPAFPEKRCDLQGTRHEQPTLHPNL